MSAAFKPSLNSLPKDVKSGGSGTLDGCTSPDGSHKGLRSATVEFSGNARSASCTNTDQVSGRVDITWYAESGQRGDRVGTTTITSDGAVSDLFDHARTTSDSDVLAHRNVRTAINPNSGMMSCLMGLSETSAQVEFAFDNDD